VKNEYPECWADQPSIRAVTSIPAWVLLHADLLGCSATAELLREDSVVMLTLTNRLGHSSFLVCPTQDYVEDRDDYWSEVFRNYDNNAGFSFVDYEYGILI